MSLKTWIAEALKEKSDFSDAVIAENLTREIEEKPDASELADIVRQLNTLDENGLTPLMILLNRKKSLIVQRLLEIPGLNLNLLDPDANNLLSRAVVENDEALVKVLITKVDSKTLNQPNKYEATLLLRAASRNLTNIVKVLTLHPDIDLNAQTYEGATALIYAISKNNIELTDYLLSLPQTNPTILDYNGLSAYAHADKNNEKIQVLLKNKGAIDTGQTHLLNQFVKYLREMQKIEKEKNGVNIQYNEDDITQFIIQLIPGQCAGLSTLWLDKKADDEESQLFGYMELISQWDGTRKKLMSSEIFEEKKFGGESSSFLQNVFEEFLNTMRWTQTTDKLLRKIDREIMTMDSYKSLNILKPKSQKLKEEFRISFIFKHNELTHLLENIVNDNKRILIGGPNHVIGVIKKGEKYYCFDPNVGKEIAFDNLTKLQSFIEYRLFTVFGLGKDKMRLTLSVTDKIVNKPFPYKINPISFARECFSNEQAESKDKSLDINRITTNNNESTLYLAAFDGDPEMVKFLLKHQDIDINNISGLYSPIKVAARFGHQEVVKILAKRSDIKLSDIWDALVIANCKGFSNIAAILEPIVIRHKVYYKEFKDVDLDDPFYKYFLRIASGDLNAIAEAIKTGVDINRKDPNGWTLLKHAMFHQSVDLVKALIKANAILTISDIGTLQANIHIAKALLEIKPIDKNIWLQFICLPIEDKNMRVIYEEIAKVTGIDKNKPETQLYIAIANSDLDSVKKLLQKDVDVNAILMDGKTALDCVFDLPDKINEPIFAFLQSLNAKYAIEIEKEAAKTKVISSSTPDLESEIKTHQVPNSFFYHDKENKIYDETNTEDQKIRPTMGGKDENHE